MLNNLKKYIPNTITTARLGMAVLFPILFLTGNVVPAFITFVTGAASDAVDGFLARRWNVQSKYGKNMDAIADKLLSGSSIIISALFINNLMILPLILETMIATINGIRYLSKDEVNTTILGKIKTGFLFSSIALCLISPVLPILNNIIMPLLIAGTAGFQVATIKSYKNQYYKNNKQQVDIEIKEDTKTEEKENNKDNQLSRIEQLKKERDFYTNINSEEKSHKKIKK
jgi:phosphatidylglycerophosphate synthase